MMVGGKKIRSFQKQFQSVSTGQFLSQKRLYELQILCLEAMVLWFAWAVIMVNLGIAHGSVASKPDSLVPLDFL